KGRVQGVFFRAKTRDKAIQIGIKGWVKNTGNDVEIVAAGTEEQLSLFLRWCNTGPDIARVDSVDVKKEEQTEKYESFNIRY
ncbi:MAG: acylphosphatase, partial [Nanoarchaeota archaeon]|nr:acylphosphatase [Nanoarchaeota archaeon]